MTNPPADGDGDDGTPSAEWPAETGRKLLAYQLTTTRGDVDDALHALIDRLYADQDPTVEDIHTARQALDRLRNDIEEFAAPVAGVEPWSDGINQLAPKYAERGESDREAATDGGRERDR